MPRAQTTILAAMTVLTFGWFALSIGLGNLPTGQPETRGDVYVSDSHGTEVVISREVYVKMRASEELDVLAGGRVAVLIGTAVVVLQLCRLKARPTESGVGQATVS